MMTMIERVARALCRKHYEKRFGVHHANQVAPNVDANWYRFIPEARAAIEAMREPTRAMDAAARPALDAIYASGKTLTFVESAHFGFIAMIDAALSEDQ